MEQNTKLTMLFQFSIILLALAAVTSEAISFGPKFHVHIVNGFKTDALHSHCKSKDDDLGMRQTNPGQEYEWSFRINFWGTTLYYCSFWWNGGRHQNDVFWVKDQFLNDYCGEKNCIWKAQEDGIYLFSAINGKFEFWYKWDK
ncbi:hypothetical protein HS088_TW18G00101 [Tripterygium wilfordii]|uniref:S-protein homolog n=1 Tax=Tripterygium wilfordii TaxID=458696 RepID=A0A7J7CB68_TRIWF|nr:S-protein homolog 2-like [Tripterygium wilfordii]KAF5731424.1 hypothetical protein HS088_TW18G00101 [Tripterygium wilfordii]